ncbi:MAG: hypothetical protein ACE5NW_06670 [Acidiferrobacterales bacterium]
MIKEDLPLPRSLVVASLTFLAFLPFVCVVLCMTTETARAKTLFIKNTFVTGGAFQLPVFASQAEAGIPIVVEKRYPPTLRAVAGIALPAKAASVPLLVVVGSVAGITAIARTFVTLVHMAATTFHESMLSF